VKTFGYLFTDPPPSGLFPPVLGDPPPDGKFPPALGVIHALDIYYLYNIVSALSPPPSASSLKLSRQMIDYWVSFATSLDPNDGLGNARPEWPQYKPSEQVLLQLNGENTTVIPDDYRNDRIDFINAHASLFRH